MAQTFSCMKYAFGLITNRLRTPNSELKIKQTQTDEDMCALSNEVHCCVPARGHMVSSWSSVTETVVVDPKNDHLDHSRKGDHSQGCQLW